MPKGIFPRKPKKEKMLKATSYGIKPGELNLLRYKIREEIVKEIEEILLSDIVPQDPRVDPMVKVYDELCNRQRESQDYFLPIGLSPWQVRQTILTIGQLGIGTERNVVLRRLLEEITRSLMKVVIDGNYGKSAEETNG